MHPDLNKPAALVKSRCMGIERVQQRSIMSTFPRLARGLALILAGLFGIILNGVAAEPAEPKVIDPGPPPSDAIVLFDGKDLAQWKSDKGGDANWKGTDGYVEGNGTGNIAPK